MKKEQLIPVRTNLAQKERAIQKAESLGLSLSSYVRFLISKDLEK